MNQIQTDILHFSWGGDSRLKNSNNGHVQLLVVVLKYRDFMIELTENSFPSQTRVTLASSGNAMMGIGSSWPAY